MQQEVTMSLSERDIAITERLTKRLQSGTKADTVSGALTVLNSIAELLDDGGTLLVRRRDGSIDRLFIDRLING